MKKIAFLAATISAFAAAPALAAPHARANASDSYASASQDPYTVVVQGVVVGRDPDATIRLQLLRDNNVNVD